MTPFCTVTGHRCGTDTWGNNNPCPCVNCQNWLANFRRTSQNQTVSGGVEGAHEGTTADKSGCGYCGKPADDLLHTCRAAHDWVDHDCHPFRAREPEKLNNAQTWPPTITLSHGAPPAGSTRIGALAESSLSSPPANPQLVIACLEEAIELFELDDEVNMPGTDSWLWKLKSEQALIAYAEAEDLTTFRQSPSLSESGAESAHSGKQDTADKSELLPTQLPKEK